MRFRALIFAILILLTSCSQKEQVKEKKFLDLRGFFMAEASRLKQHHITVNKTASRNGASESKLNISPDWETELALFSESDINKPAWNDSYQVHSEGNYTYYLALDNKLRTRSIKIRKDESGKTTALEVTNITKNYLYSSSEELLYVPDSLYRIVKKQDVILLGSNDYEITGFF